MDAPAFPVGLSLRRHCWAKRRQSPLLRSFRRLACAKGTSSTPETARSRRACTPYLCSDRQECCWRFRGRIVALKPTEPSEALPDPGQRAPLGGGFEGLRFKEVLPFTDRYALPPPASRVMEPLFYQKSQRNCGGGFVSKIAVWG
jgi:hypothetical protein